MATIKEIAEIVGVSSSAVSRVLNYDEGISVSDETREAIFATAEKIGYKKRVIYPKIENVALLYFGKKITYRQLFRETEKAEKAFLACGVRRGDNVALCVPATPEAIYAILALNKIGANANMLNPTFTQQQRTDRINDTEAALLLVVGELYDQLEDVIPQTKIKTVAIGGGVSANSGVRNAVQVYCERRGIKAFIPKRSFTTDNAAMIAVAGYYEYCKGTRSGWDLNAVPNLKLGER